MRINAKAGLIVLLFLMFLMPASAMTVSEARVGNTLVVSDLSPGATVQFILNGGVPVFAVADDSGTARYLPLLEGSLEIVVMQGGEVTERKTIPVLSEITPTPTAGPGGGGPSGAGTGGSGVITAEPSDNILMYLTIDGSLIVNASTLYNFSRLPDLGIYEILVTGEENENVVSIRVELLKGTSKLVKVPPDGNVYMNVNVWPGSKRIKEGRIRFKVDNTWITGSGGGSGDVKMLRWDGINWMQLETAEIAKDAAYTFYEARTDRFSPFAVISLKGAVVPTTPEVTAEVTPTAIPTGTPTPAAVQPSIAWVYILILIVVVAIVSYLYMTMRRK